MMANNTLDITKKLGLNFAHLSEETEAMLHSGDLREWATILTLEPDAGCMVLAVWYNEEHVPADLQKCLDFAVKNDCQWVHFDNWGVIVDSLETYQL